MRINYASNIQFLGTSLQIPGTNTGTDPKKVNSVIFLEKLVPVNSHNLAAVINKNKLVTFRISGTPNPNLIDEIVEYPNFTINKPTTYNLEPLDSLDLLESTPTDINFALKYKAAGEERYTIGIVRFKPTPTSQLLHNYFRVNGELLASSEFVFRTSGVRNAINSSDLLILYEEAIYFWKWQSESNHPYYIHLLPNSVPKFNNFETIRDTDLVIFIKSPTVVKLYSLLKPTSTNLEIANIDPTKPYDFCVNNPTTFTHMAFNHAKNSPYSISTFFYERFTTCGSGGIICDTENLACKAPMILGLDKVCYAIPYTCPNGNLLNACYSTTPLCVRYDSSQNCEQCIYSYILDSLDKTCKCPLSTYEESS